MNTRIAALTFAASLVPLVATAQKTEQTPVSIPIVWQTQPARAATPTSSPAVPASAAPAWAEVPSSSVGPASNGTPTTPTLASREEVAPAQPHGRLALSIAAGVMSPSYSASGTSRTHLPPVAQVAFFLGGTFVRTSSRFTLSLGYQLESSIDPTAIVHRHELGLALRKAWFFTVVGVGGGLLHTFDGETAPVASLTARPGFELGATGLFVAAPWTLDLVIDDRVILVDAFGLTVGWQHI